MTLFCAQMPPYARHSNSISLVLGYLTNSLIKKQKPTHMILVYCCSNWLADIVYLRSGVNSDAYPNQLKDYHIPF